MNFVKKATLIIAIAAGLVSCEEKKRASSILVHPKGVAGSVYEFSSEVRNLLEPLEGRGEIDICELCDGYALDYRFSQDKNGRMASVPYAKAQDPANNLANMLGGKDLASIVGKVKEVYDSLAQADTPIFPTNISSSEL